MMRSMLAVLALATVLSGPAVAQGDRADAIRGVIRSQIEAFLADDFATAFGFASPGIQSMFGTPQRFGTMVRNGYPMVWRPDEVEFLDLRTVDGRLWQAVMVRDASGQYHVLGYRMEKADDGSWKIDGVQILRQPEVGA